jgi:hypothetical protein
VISIAAPAAAPTTPPIRDADGPELLAASTACKLATRDGVTYTVGMTVVTNTRLPSGIVEVRVTGISLVTVTSAVLKWVTTDAVVFVVVSDAMLTLVDVIVVPAPTGVLLGVRADGGLDVGADEVVTDDEVIVI